MLSSPSSSKPSWNSRNIEKMDPAYRTAIANGSVKTDPFTYSKVAEWIKMTNEGYKFAESPSDVPAGAQNFALQIPANPGLPAGAKDGQSMPGYGAAPASVGNWYKGGSDSASAAPAPAPAAAAPTGGPSYNAPGNPQLSIPGINVRLTGEQIGIKPAESSARKERKTTTGTSRLTIPRSTGASGLNLGM